MSKVRIEWSKPYNDTVDLYEWGHEDLTWSELSEEQKTEIRDSLRDEIIVQISGETEI